VESPLTRLGITLPEDDEMGWSEERDRAIATYGRRCRDAWFASRAKPSLDSDAAHYIDDELASRIWKQISGWLLLEHASRELHLAAQRHDLDEFHRLLGVVIQTGRVVAAQARSRAAPRGV
jgi:hypothetical protein